MDPRDLSAGLRFVMDEAYDPADERIASALSEQLGSLSESQQADFNRALRTIGQVAQPAVSGAAQGAAAGSAAGPWGALIGGLAMGAMSAAAATNQPNAGARRMQPAPTVGRPPPMPNAGRPMPSTAPSTPNVAAATPNVAGAQLLALLQDPRVLQAVASAVMGELGRRSVPIGSASAPPAAFLNALSVLSQQAAEEMEAVDSDVNDAYLRDTDGEFIGDVASPTERAYILVEHLQNTRNVSADDVESEPSADAAADWLLRSGAAKLRYLGF